MKRKIKSGKINFFCYLAAFLCFYASAVFDIIHQDNNWVIGLCLGSAFFCLAGNHWKGDSGEDKENGQK